MPYDSTILQADAVSLQLKGYCCRGGQFKGKVGWFQITTPTFPSIYLFAERSISPFKWQQIFSASGPGRAFIITEDSSTILLHSFSPGLYLHNWQEKICTPFNIAIKTLLTHPNSSSHYTNYILKGITLKSQTK